VSRSTEHTEIPSSDSLFLVSLFLASECSVSVRRETYGTQTSFCAGSQSECPRLSFPYREGTRHSMHRPHLGAYEPQQRLLAWGQHKLQDNTCRVAGIWRLGVGSEPTLTSTCLVVLGCLHIRFVRLDVGNDYIQQSHVWPLGPRDHRLIQDPSRLSIEHSGICRTMAAPLSSGISAYISENTSLSDRLALSSDYKHPRSSPHRIK
jgi:hypothetical protein